LKREFMHRRILSPAVELLPHPTQLPILEHAVASAAPAASYKSRVRSLTGVGKFSVHANAWLRQLTWQKWLSATV
jgi:hypothetical protein